MKPKPRAELLQRELFRVELSQIVDAKHALVRLGEQIDWDSFEKLLGQTYCANNGAPGIKTRLMVALHYLKYQHDLSDEEVVRGWVENPYWQSFSGGEFFEHELPIDPSSMTRWRKRLGEAGAEMMLKATIQTACKVKAMKPAQMEQVNVDTTAQTKNVRFPTDSRLYNRARERLVKQARKEGFQIKQSYERVGRKLLMQQNRYAHARQMKRAAKCTKKLNTNLGRIIREIGWQEKTPSEKLQKLLETAQRIHEQKPHDKNKIYSVHAPEVACIAKGKVGRKYEFGNKVSLAVSSAGGWVLGAQSHKGTPYDGHTLKEQLNQVNKLHGESIKPRQVYVDMGYKGHNHDGPEDVIVDKRRRGSTPRGLWKKMKRRAAIEPTIGHLKAEHRLERNRLHGTIGDTLNILFSAAAMNFQKLLRFFLCLFFQLLKTNTDRPHFQQNRLNYAV
jgi:IS5 family transposase